MTIEKKNFGFFGTYNKEIVGKKWFVCYYTPDYTTGKFKKKKYYGEINKYDTIEERLAECERIKILIDQNKELPNFRGARRLLPKNSSKNFASVILLLNLALDERKINIDNTSYINYKSIIRSLELWLNKNNLNDITIGNFTETYARNFLLYIKKNGLANKTHNNYKVILGSLWKDIARKLKGAVHIVNVWNDIKSLKKNTQPFKVYTTDIENIVVNKLPLFDKQLWLYILFTHYGFVRGTENRKLKIDCIDFNNKTITIKSIISKVSEQRIITIPEHLFNEILEHKLDTYPKHYFIFSAAGCPSEKPVGKNYFGIKWNKFRLQNNISNEFKIYPFKHTGMIKANRSGIDLKQIQLQAGHHSLDQVNDYLATMNIDNLKKLQNSFPRLGEEPTNNSSNPNDEVKNLLHKILEKMDK